MPCSKGMTACSRSCLHRRLVSEYRTARLAGEMRRDEAVGAYGYDSPEWREYEPKPLTFKQWLIGTGGQSEVRP